MSGPLVVVSENMHPDGVAVLSASVGNAVRYHPDLVDDRTDLMATLAEAEALIVRNRTRVGAALLAAAPDLRVVGRLGVGRAGAQQVSNLSQQEIAAVLFPNGLPVAGELAVDDPSSVNG